MARQGKGRRERRRQLGMFNKHLRDWWSRAVELMNREGGWAKAFFRQLGPGSRLGRKRSQRPEDRTDFEKVGCSRHLLCWDGGSHKNGCGAGMWVKIFTQALGWHTVHKICGPVLAWNSLDAAISWCSMSLESTKMWVEKCVCYSDSLPLHDAFSHGMLGTRVDRN